MADDLFQLLSSRIEGPPEITIWKSDGMDDMSIEDVADDFSNISDDFDGIGVEGVITNLSGGVLKLLNLLQNDPRNWVEFHFSTMGGDPPDQPSSPAFLAILSAAMKKTKRLLINWMLSDTTAYSCLATGLLGHEGIQELCLDNVEKLEVDAAEALAKAMVCTTCRLKRLELRGRVPHYVTENRRNSNYVPENVCAVLVEGLKRNRSLEALVLGFRNDGLSKFLRRLQNHPNLRSLTLQNKDISAQTMSEQVMEDLRGWLSREDCRLHDLEICRASRLPTFSRSIGGKVFESRTLKRLELSSTNLLSSDLEGLGLCTAFPNLTILSLGRNKICDLSPFEAILCKEGRKECCKIQEVNLQENRISGDAIMEFAAKIPLMKSLRRLYLDDNPFLAEISSLDEREQSASLRPLLESVKQSKSLERLSIKCKIGALERLSFWPCQVDATELCHTMSVNRGGRYGIEVESANRLISLALWPRILHRASSIKYFANINSKWFEKVEEPTDKSPRATVVFSLLRDHAYIFEHFGKTDEDAPPSLPASKKRKVEAR
eukprot:CAMPEP_0113636010 /NCGR_PEP_ID=MMETSP0017_2-20120614/18791_1 /TAXON_ID=2856 /ORGANISM="Cylindrotheca closterium" /LENGTH=547 /DNA_ID=CAMNT_0000546855 /DNA_START=1 /DNA_END=1644 /DNA_ORIENTATION=- /assembly_acc=CAM_ASM_000147